MIEKAHSGPAFYWIGWLILAFGWFMLINGVGIDSPMGTIANLHRTAIAQSAILTGLFFILTGAVINALAPKVAVAASGQREAVDSVPPQAGANVDPKDLAARIAAAQAKLK